MENQQKNDDGYSSRKAIESVPDKALLLPDINSETPERGKDSKTASSGDQEPEAKNEPDTEQFAEGS